MGNGDWIGHVDKGRGGLALVCGLGYSRRVTRVTVDLMLLDSFTSGKLAIGCEFIVAMSCSREEIMFRTRILHIYTPQGR